MLKVLVCSHFYCSKSLLNKKEVSFSYLNFCERQFISRQKNSPSSENWELKANLFDEIIILFSVESIDWRLFDLKNGIARKAFCTYLYLLKLVLDHMKSQARICMMIVLCDKNSIGILEQGKTCLFETSMLYTTYWQYFGLSSSITIA